MAKLANVRTMRGYRAWNLARTQKTIIQKYGEKLRNVTIADIGRDQVALRAYPGLAACDMGQVADHIIRATVDSITTAELKEAERVKLGAEEIVEDAAAGEASRLGLGTKYLLTPKKLADAILLHNTAEPYDPPIPMSTNALKLAPISLGLRHKAQYVFDLTNLAATPAFSPALNPAEVLKDQVTLTIVNEETALGIIRELVQLNHLGLAPENTLFMVQEKGLGMSIEDGQLYYDPGSDFKLWNHGDMKIQQTLAKKVFWARINPKKGELEFIYLTPEEMETKLAAMKNLISYPIEDLDYLTGSINMHNLALALRLGQEGYHMTMEAVAQQVPPQKGGFFTFDPAVGKVVCIESDCGGTVVVNDDPPSLAQIEYLNKNFNNFPFPVNAFRALSTQEMPGHLAPKDGWLYTQTPQGDQNFNIPTAVVMWDPIQAIRNLKQLPHCAPTLLDMLKQDQQPEFLDFAKSLSLI